MSASAVLRRRPKASPEGWVAGALVAAPLALLFGGTVWELIQDWAVDPEYGHGFLMLPIAVVLAWKKRLSRPRPATVTGLLLLAVAVAVFLLGVLAAEYFTRRMAMLLALGALSVYYLGWAQARAWWLPFGLLAFSVPLPEVVLNSLTLPLQLFASEIAVGLLQFRHIPAAQVGNIIFLPGQELFVAEACSGLRSVSALLGLTLLIAGTTLRSVPGRAALLALALPAAIAANTLRVFATGFGAYYLGPAFATGATHTILGIVVFVLPLAFVGLLTVLVGKVER